MNMIRLMEKTRQALPLLACPFCGGGFTIRENSLVCEKGHCYDWSRKGYGNLAPGHSQAGDSYSDELFESRGRILSGVFYQKPMAAVAALLQKYLGTGFSLLDAGCGEGAWSRYLASVFPQATLLAVDLNRDGVSRGAAQPSPVHYLVADVKRLPVQTASLDGVLDVLTPADYREFHRVLKPEGILLKVVPGQAYLQQIRQEVSAHLHSGEVYSNARVLVHLQEHAQVLEQLHLTETFPLTREQARDFLRMTPLTFSVSPELLSQVKLEEITVDLHLLCCRVLGE